MNAAQTWITQILHESSDDVTRDIGSSGAESLTDGRILCRVVNEISPESVIVIHDDETAESQVSNISSFLRACRRLGVPEGALFDVDDRDPQRVGLCLYVLSRVVQDTVPSFPGPFLAAQPVENSSQSDSDESSSSDDDTSGSCTERRPNNNGQPYQYQHPMDHTDSFLSCRQGNARAQNILDTTEQEQHEERDTAHRTSAENLLESSHITPVTSTPQPKRKPRGRLPAPPPYCPPPATSPGRRVPMTQLLERGKTSPSPSQHSARRERSQTKQRQQPRPISLPSRLPHDIVGEREGWNPTVLISPMKAEGEAVGDGHRLFEAVVTEGLLSPTRGTEWSNFFVDSQEVNGHRRQQPTASTSFTPASANSLSSWLSGLNLSAFEPVLVGIGVETIGDLRYVAEEDLAAIGMHGPQIRKFLQNRP